MSIERRAESKERGVRRRKKKEEESKAITKTRKDESTKEEGFV